MDKRFDIKVEADFVNLKNDIEVYESDTDHIEATIEASKGEYKEFPEEGVQINKYLNSAGKEQEISREINIQLRTDGYNPESPSVKFETDGTLTINPNVIL